MLVNALQDHALTWYIKHSNDNLNVGVADIHTTVKKEFNRPKSEAQSIIGFKEILILPSLTPWELDQRLKCIICEVNMTLTDRKHRKWFVASLKLHLWNALSQQRLTTQAKDLEVTMRLHENLIQDPNLGVQ